jgi:hypothetical protein
MNKRIFKKTYIIKIPRRPLPLKRSLITKNEAKQSKAKQGKD